MLCFSGEFSFRITNGYGCKGVFYPQQDALLVELIIANCRVRRMLIDEGSLANIIFLNTLRWMGIEETKLEVFQTNLVGFNGNHPPQIFLISWWKVN